jgi:penicillin-binding protein 1B
VTVSRPARVAIFVALGLVAFAILAYGFRLNRELSRQIVGQPWRHPVEIVSAVSGEDSEPFVRLYGEDWRVTEPVEISQLPEYVPKAFVAAEDKRFYRHPGIDAIGLARAMWINLRNRRIVQGGSTITQQLIKQKLFSNDRTLKRKIPEMLLAPILTARMSKDEVLEGYLNDVYLGEFGGAAVLGIDEGSRMFFNKLPTELTIDEAALLAATVRAPNRDNPFKRPERARERRNRILATMQELEWISEEEYEKASSRRIRLREGDLPDAPYAHYLSAMRTELAKVAPGLPPSGIRILCEMDPKGQRAAEQIGRRGVASLRNRYRWLGRRDDLQIALLSADPRTGGIRALVGSRDFAADAYDRTRRMRRQPGSALKPFVYAAALQSRKFTTISILEDQPIQIELARNRSWSPENYDGRFRGPVMLRQALEQSLNVPTVRLAQAVGLGDVTEALHDFGFQEKFEQVPSLPLGVGTVSLREMVSAYSVFPALGEQAPLHLVREVRNRRGRTLYRADDDKRKVCDPALAWLMHDILRGVVLRGTASRIRDAGLDHIAGKTGTTNDYRDAWFIGYAPDLVTGLWIGFDEGAPLRLSAGEAAVPLWTAYMSAVPSSRTEIAPPPGIVVRDVDPSSGLLWEPGCPGPVREAFLNGTEPRQGCLGAQQRLPSILALLRGDTEPPFIEEVVIENPGEKVPIIVIRRRPIRAHGRIPVVIEADEDRDYRKRRREWEKRVREFEKARRKAQRRDRDDDDDD